MHYGGPPNAAKHVAGWRAKVDAGQATWKRDYVNRKRRYPAPRDDAPSPAGGAGAGTTASRGESRNSLTNQHDRRSALSLASGAGRLS